MLADYSSPSGQFEAVFTLEIQTVPRDVDTLLDAVMAVHPLGYGRYQRNASVSAVGKETSQAQVNSTTSLHQVDYQPRAVTSFPMVELKVSIERDVSVLAQVMEAILAVHHYEQPVIFLREDWASRAHYDPNNPNPHRWWNNAVGLPPALD